MKGIRFEREVYADIAKVRAKFGADEYSRDDIIPSIIGVLEAREVAVDLMKHHTANYLLDRIESAEDAKNGDQKEMFSDDAHVPLGDGRRIRRGKMNAQHFERRQKVIDDTIAAQNRAYEIERDFNLKAIDLLRDYPIGTTYEDAKKRRAASERRTQPHLETAE